MKDKSILIKEYLSKIKGTNKELAKKDILIMAWINPQLNSTSNGF